MLTAQKIEEQAYKSCMGLLQAARKYSAERLENACAKAREINSCSASHSTVRPSVAPMNLMNKIVLRVLEIYANNAKLNTIL